MSKKSHHFLMLWPWPLTYDLEKLIRSGHYHYQCVYQIWEQSIQWFLSYRVNTIAGGGRRAAGGGWRAAGGGRRTAGGGRLRRKTITSPDPSDTGDIIMTTALLCPNPNLRKKMKKKTKNISHLDTWACQFVGHFIQAICPQCTKPSPWTVGHMDECMTWQEYPLASMLAEGN